MHYGIVQVVNTLVNRGRARARVTSPRSRMQISSLYLLYHAKTMSAMMETQYGRVFNLRQGLLRSTDSSSLQRVVRLYLLFWAIGRSLLAKSDSYLPLTFQRSQKKNKVHIDLPLRNR